LLQIATHGEGIARDQRERCQQEPLIATQSEEIACDRRAITKLMKRDTGQEPRMWGASIGGYGRYHYKSASGREGERMLTGSGPRKANLSLYILTGLDKSAAQLKKLGNHSTGVGCLYIKRLSDVDVKVLEELIVKGVKGLEKMRVK
jgi:hypothetical protein